ncbi:MAG: serine hydrolase domain-containing protein, partial [Pirellulales bacterium]
MDSGRLELIDEAVAEALAEGKMPGCVVLVSRYGKQVFLKAYGRRALLPEPVDMTSDTVFDVASLTKPIATATSVMLLSERSQLGPDDAAAQYLADFGRHGKEQITIRQLLTHQGGLIADNPLSDFDDGADAAFKQIDELEPIAPPGTRFVYSDVGFIVLGRMVEQVSGQDLHAFTRQHLFEPLGMRETTFLPAEELRRRSAPTEQRDGRWVQGEVHDPRAFQLGGVAGPPGLFSTADDLAVYAQMLLNQGTYAGVRVLEPETVQRMISPQQVPGGLRGLGWDIRTGYSSNRGEGFS